MPPARMQMIESEMAKLEKPLMRRAQLLGVAQAVQEADVVADVGAVLGGALDRPPCCLHRPSP